MLTGTITHQIQFQPIPSKNRLFYLWHLPCLTRCPCSIHPGSPCGGICTAEALALPSHHFPMPSALGRRGVQFSGLYCFKFLFPLYINTQVHHWIQLTNCPTQGSPHTSTHASKAISTAPPPQPSDEGWFLQFKKKIKWSENVQRSRNFLMMQ